MEVGLSWVSCGKKLSFQMEFGWWLGGSKFPSRAGLLDVVDCKQFHHKSLTLLRITIARLQGIYEYIFLLHCIHVSDVI